MGKLDGICNGKLGTNYGQNLDNVYKEKLGVNYDQNLDGDLS